MGYETEQHSRWRDASRERVEKRGFEQGELQSLYRSAAVLDRPYDSHETVDAICDALTREGCTAWPGDGTYCVEQMIQIQYNARQRAQERVRALEETITSAFKYLEGGPCDRVGCEGCATEMQLALDILKEAMPKDTT